MTKNSITSTYKYNESGIRTQKTEGSITTNYYLNGDRAALSLPNP